MENQNPNQNINPFPENNNPGGNSFNNPNQQNFGQGGNQAVPNATAVLVLGIVSIVMCWCYGILGIICAIIALAISKKGYEAYNANPSLYSQASFNNLKGGKICGVIGLVLGILFMIFYICFYTYMFTTMSRGGYPFR